MRAVALLLVLGACASSLPPVPVARFQQGDLQPVLQFFEEQAHEGDTDAAALWINGMAQVEMLLGRTEEAWRHFRTAGNIMGNWQTPGSETFAAVVGSESSKTWKGDPYEKAMNAYYTGLLYLFRGGSDNARASFLQGLLADAETGEGEERYQEDFALLHWLAGRMSLRMGLPADADRDFEQAREARHFAVGHGAYGAAEPSVLADPAAGNVVLLFDVGLGPEKYAGGRHGELARFRARDSGVHGVEVFVDGEPRGRAEVLADLYYQATTRGGTAMEGIRAGKAVLKTGTRVAGTVLLHGGLHDRGSGSRDKLLAGGLLWGLSFLISTRADTRHWTLLPATVQVLTLDLPPGEHELRLEFLGAGGQPLPGLTQTWTIQPSAEEDQYYFFRSLPDLDRLQGEP